MWYYQKNGDSVGPLADSALKRYYELGRIEDTTLVWFKGLQGWTPLNKTKRYTTFFKRRYKRLDSFTFKTRIFRAFLLAYAIMNILRVYFDYKHLNIYEKILDLGSATSFLKLHALEHSQVANAYNIFSVVLLVFLLRALVRWFYFAMYNAQLFDKGFMLSPSFYSFSYFIPIVNLIAPYYALWKTFRVSKLCAGRSMNIFDANYIVLFWFFNIFTMFVAITYIFLHTGAYDIEVERGLTLFSSYTSLLIACTCFLWFLIVTKVYNVQAKILMNFE